MRISGVRSRPGQLGWLAIATGLLVLGVLVAVGASAAGLVDADAAERPSARPVTATVSVGVSCTASGARETVTFTGDDGERTAQFDGCGHREGEQVEIMVPSDAPAEGLVVRAAGVAAGDEASGAGAGFAGLLLVVASLAGAGYAFLVRRGPRGTPLPPPLRLAG